MKIIITCGTGTICSLIIKATVEQMIREIDSDVIIDTIKADDIMSVSSDYDLCLSAVALKECSCPYILANDIVLNRDTGELMENIRKTVVQIKNAQNAG